MKIMDEVMYRAGMITSSLSMRKVFASLFLFAIAVNIIAAAEVTENIEEALCDLYDGVNTLVPIAAVLMVVLAGVVYAGGQMMGAETRARANVWATAMLTGALIGILIVVIAPIILKTMLGESLEGACDAYASDVE